LAARAVAFDLTMMSFHFFTPPLLMVSVAYGHDKDAVVPSTVVLKQSTIILLPLLLRVDVNATVDVIVVVSLDVKSTDRILLTLKGTLTVDSKLLAE
jgi:hypothetical protein